MMVFFVFLYVKDKNQTAMAPPLFHVKHFVADKVVTL